MFPGGTGTSSSIARDEGAGDWVLEADLESGLPAFLNSGCTLRDWVFWEDRVLADFGLKLVIPFSNCNNAEEGKKELL